MNMKMMGQTKQIGKNRKSNGRETEMGSFMFQIGKGMEELMYVRKSDVC